MPSSSSSPDSSITIYSESIRPWFAPVVFFVPCFYNYGIIVEQSADATTQSSTLSATTTTSITFGYGMFKPTKRGITTHTVLVKNINPSSVVTGEATWRENITQCGGWGIRYNWNNQTWTYNATFSGPYCEFVEAKGGKSTKYRIVTENPDTVAAILRGE